MDRNLDSLNGLKEPVSDTIPGNEVIETVQDNDKNKIISLNKTTPQETIVSPTGSSDANVSLNAINLSGNAGVTGVGNTGGFNNAITINNTQKTPEGPTKEELQKEKEAEKEDLEKTKKAK